MNKSVFFPGTGSHNPTREEEGTKNGRFMKSNWIQILNFLNPFLFSLLLSVAPFFLLFYCCCCWCCCIGLRFAVAQKNRKPAVCLYLVFFFHDFFFRDLVAGFVSFCVFLFCFHFSRQRGERTDGRLACGARGGWRRWPADSGCGNAASGSRGISAVALEEAFFYGKIFWLLICKFGKVSVLWTGQNREITKATVSLALHAV